MMKNHEAIVHFPIALLLCAFLFSLIGLFYKRGLFKEVIFWNLSFGLLSIIVAIYTGLMEQEQVSDPHLQEELSLHRRNAYIIGSLVFCLVIWMGWRKKRMKNLEYVAWVALFFIASSSVTYQGYMGHNMSAKNMEIQASKLRPVQKQQDYGWNF